MTLLELLQSLRERLAHSLKTTNRDDLMDLYITFTILRQTIQQGQYPTLLKLLVNMEDAAQDGTMGVVGKNPVPSVAALEQAFLVEAH